MEKEKALTVGDCQAIYDKYNLGISEHTRETTKLCRVILNLEHQSHSGEGESQKERLEALAAQYPDRLQYFDAATTTQEKWFKEVGYPKMAFMGNAKAFSQDVVWLRFHDGGGDTIPVKSIDRHFAFLMEEYLAATVPQVEGKE